MNQLIAQLKAAVGDNNVLEGGDLGAQVAVGGVARGVLVEEASRVVERGRRDGGDAGGRKRSAMGGAGAGAGERRGEAEAEGGAERFAHGCPSQ